MSKATAKKKVSEDIRIDEQILHIVMDALEDSKAEDIVCIDLQGKTSIASYMVIASGTSQRHVASTAERVQERLKAAGFSSAIEGEEKADWVLIDAFDVIVHIFKPEVRAFYSLEKMWSSLKIRSVDN